MCHHACKLQLLVNAPFMTSALQSSANPTWMSKLSYKLSLTHSFGNCYMRMNVDKQPFQGLPQVERMRHQSGHQILLVQPGLSYQYFLLIQVKKPLIQTVVVTASVCGTDLGSHWPKQMLWTDSCNSRLFYYPISSLNIFIFRKSHQYRITVFF